MEDLKGPERTGNYTFVILLCSDSESQFSKNQKGRFQNDSSVCDILKKKSYSLSCFITTPKEKYKPGQCRRQTYLAFREIHQSV